VAAHDVAQSTKPRGESRRKDLAGSLFGVLPAKIKAKDLAGTSS